MLSKKRPEEFIVEITSRLKEDICKMAQHFRYDTVHQQKPPTNADIEAEVCEMIVALSTALNSLVKYTKAHTVAKHIEETKEE